MKIIKHDEKLFKKSKVSCNLRQALDWMCLDVPHITTGLNVLVKMVVITCMFRLGYSIQNSIP